MKHTNLTLTIAAALGMGLAGSGMAGSGHGHSAEASSPSSSYHSSSGGASGIESGTGLDSSGSGSSSSDASASFGGMDSSEQASVSGSELTLPVDEPTLLFSDGQWYSYTDGEWYAFDNGEWYRLSSSADWSSSDWLTSDAYGYDDALALDGSSSYAVSSYHAIEAPYYEVTLYSTDGIDWYSMDGEQVMIWSPVAVVRDSEWIANEALEDAAG